MKAIFGRTKEAKQPGQAETLQLAANPQPGQATAAQKGYLKFEDKPNYRIRYNIDTWTAAQNMANLAEYPRNYLLQKLFADIQLDAHLVSQIEIRKQQVFSSNASLYNADGSENEEQTAILRNLPCFKDINAAILESTYSGYQLIEFVFDRQKQLTVTYIPNTNVVPKTGLFYPDYTDDLTYIKYREMPEFGTWILEFNTGGLGLLNKTVPHVLYKRFAQACWSELCEIYGIPPRFIKTDTTNAAQVRRSEKMLKDTGSAAYFVIDTSEELVFGQGTATNGDVYKNLITNCKNEISTIINGAVIGQDTVHGNHSGEDAKQELQWLLVQADLENVEEKWNNLVYPALVKLGIFKAGLRYKFDNAEDIKQLFTFTEGLLNFYEVDPDWIMEKFNVQVTGPRANPSGGAAPSQGSLSFFREAASQAANSKLTLTNCCGNHLTLSLPKNNFDQQAVAQRFFDAGGSLTFDAGLFFYTAQMLITGLKKGFKKGNTAKLSVNISFEYGVDDPAVLTAFEQNLFRFSAAKTLAEAQELNAIFRNSTGFRDFYNQAQAKMDVFNKDWLETEFNTAFLTAQASSTFYRLKAQTELFPYWQYKTVGDDKVRPAHRALEGLVLPAGSPAWDSIYPPNGWNCRCYVVPRLESQVKNVDHAAMQDRAAAYLESDEFTQNKKQGFGVNRAETGEVFTQNQFYMQTFDTQGAKLLNEIGAADYGLPDAETAQKTAVKEAPTFDADLQSFTDKLEKLNGKPIMRDYNNRPLELPAKIGKEETANLLAMQETVADPDEVWVNNADSKTYGTFVSIKYYNDTEMVVFSEVDKGKVYSISTWFKQAVSEAFRKGLLIFSKK